MPAKVPMLAVASAIIATAAAIGYCVRRAGLIEVPAGLSVVLSVGGGLLRLIFVIAVASGALWERADNPALFLLAYATPWVWLVMIPPPQVGRTLGNMFSRTVAGLVASFQTLHAYPVAGSQTIVAVFLLIPAAAVCGHDVWKQMAGLRLPKMVTRAAAFVASLAIALAWCWMGVASRQEYLQLTPLNLPGARWVRLNQFQAAVLHCLSKNLHEQCDTFFSTPGLNSFYFWSEHKPPTALNAGHWMTLLDDKQQRAIIEQLERYPNACLVRFPLLIPFWLQGRDMSDQPLARYLNEHFDPRVLLGNYELCVRSGRQLPPLTEAANVETLPKTDASHSSDSEFYFPNASSKVMLTLQLPADDYRTSTIARVIIVDIAKQRLLADSREQSLRGISLLDDALHPIKLPLSPGWMNNSAVATLHLVPNQRLPILQARDSSRVVMVGLLNEHGETIALLPLAVPLGQ